MTTFQQIFMASASHMHQITLFDTLGFGIVVMHEMIPPPVVTILLFLKQKQK